MTPIESSNERTPTPGCRDDVPSALVDHSRHSAAFGAPPGAHEGFAPVTKTGTLWQA